MSNLGHNNSLSLQETFIRNLRYYRKKKGLTQTELTMEIDMGLNYINGVEQAAFFPKPDVIDRMAGVLDVKPGQLFDENAEGRIFVTEDAGFLVETITDRLIQKLRPCVHNEVEEVIRGLLR